MLSGIAPAHAPRRAASFHRVRSHFVARETGKRMRPAVTHAVLLLSVVAAILLPCRSAAQETPAHPYLFLSTADVDVLRVRLQKEPFAHRWESFLAHAERCLRTGTPGPGQATRRSRRSLGVAGTTSFAYLITGEERFGLRAKKELLALLQSERWHGSWGWNKGADLSTAELSVAAALVYDWCYDLLDPAERRTIKEGILEKSIRVYLRSLEARPDWWVNNPVTNWSGVCHGGSGLAALALYHDSPDAARAADLAREHVRRFLRSVILSDGGGHEGVMYWRYGVTFGNYLATAAARFYGDDAGLRNDYVQKVAGYWDVYMQGPDLAYANFNNMSERTFHGLYASDPRLIEGGPRSCLNALFESRVPGGDPLLLWAADNGADKFYWEGTSPFYFLWRRDAPPAGLKPQLQDAVLFRGAGHAVLQSPRLWFAYNGGWTSNRSHANKDLGTFVLVAGGERFVSDPGYGLVQSGDHSTVLVDGKGQPTNVRGTYRRFGSGDGFAYLASDLSACYPETGLKRFVRHVLIIRGTYMVVLDDLEAERPAEFEWRLQSRLPTKAHPVDRRATVQGSATDLHVVVAAPTQALIKAESMLATRRRGRGRPPMHRTSVRPSSAVREPTIVVVLYPVASGGAPPQVRFDDEFGLTVTDGDRTDRITFERTAAAWELRAVNGQDASSLPMGTERTLVRLGKQAVATENSIGP